MVRAQLLRCFSGNTHTRRIHQTLIHNVICKTWAMWSGPPAAPMMSLLCGVNKLTRRNKSQRAHAHTTSTAVMEELWGVPAPTQYKKTLTHTHTLSLGSHDISCACSSHVWACGGFVCPLGNLSSLYCLRKCPCNQIVSHNQKMAAQMFFLRIYSASNLLLSCYSLNRFALLSLQIFWHITWCMRLIYKCNGNLGVMRILVLKLL